MSCEERQTSLSRNDDDDDDTDPDESIQRVKRLKTYSLSSGITLKVSSLAESEGIMSPLGAQAWHASSLLAAYLILHQDSLFENTIRDEEIHCLELGSGAVGLSGMALAAVLDKTYPHSSILLTDLTSESGILENLQENVQRNKPSYPNGDVRVQPLDWNDYTDHESAPSLPSLDLVVGSELVYTEETAIACAAVITRLLHDNPNLTVLIIQVTDRPGFETHFLPLLQTNFVVRVQQPLDAELHEAASRTVAGVGEQLGGTLDRFAYGACWIRRRTEIDNATS